MRLDVYLERVEPVVPGSGIFVREDGATREITREEWDARFPGCEPVVAEVDPERVFSLNITHNLGEMAEAAGIYHHLWRPEEIGITTAEQLVEPLATGLQRLRADPIGFKRYDSPNGWGTYDGLVRFVSAYLDACREHPSATVRVWR